LEGGKMKSLIVFGGGTEGALLLTEERVLPLPPLKPELLSSIKAAGRLVHALAAAQERAIQSKLSKMAIGAANLAVEMAEAQFGALNPNRAIIYQDGEGGFTCGSTGKPPLPFPWPPRPIREPQDLVRQGVIEADVLELIRAAKAGGRDLTQVFEKPAAAAKDLGLKLSGKSAEALQLLAPSNLARIQDPVDQEVMKMFHAVLKDGRFTTDWFERPKAVADALKVKLSESALERIIAVGGRGSLADRLSDGGTAIAAGVIWAGVCIAVGTLFVGQMNPIDTLIRDRSGLDKF
jgi:hypothetical protein